jgi:Zn-dependent M16 (insulinase) family peptidase
MRTDWESLSKTQTRLAYISVIMEAAEKFDDKKEESVNDTLRILYEYCVVYARSEKIKLCVPFPTEEKES